MAVGLDEIERMLVPSLGSELLAREPELIYDVAGQLRRYRHSEAALTEILESLSDLLFSTVYRATGKTMRVVLDDGRQVRLTQEQLFTLADRLLALRYGRLPADSVLRDDLLQLSMANSYAAMRELLRRFPMESGERSFMEQVLRENDETE